jgi:hypothetical protein
MTVWSDIIDYHGAPVTIVKGAKVANLEKGPRRVWGGIPVNGDVYNLEMAADPVLFETYLNRVKMTMHELTGVPEAALGQMQPISNTSGVALSIMYQPLMIKYNIKIASYGWGLKRINELIIRTLALKEPSMLVFDPQTSGQLELEPDQYPALNFNDPITYETTVHWPPPLPVDILIKLNEIQVKMSLGLMSKEGALRELGEEFPYEVLEEIFQEQQRDLEMQGALDLGRANISAAISESTGMVPMPDGSSVPLAAQAGSSGGGSSSTEGGAAGPPPVPMPSPMAAAGIVDDVKNRLVTAAYGTKAPQRRNPGSDGD